VNIVTVVAALTSLLAAGSSAFGVRTQRKLTAAQAALTSSQVKQSDLELVQEALGLHKKTVTERLQFLSEQLEDAKASKIETLATVYSLEKEVERMALTISELLAAVNGALPPEWRTRLQNLVA
jgi:chromosome segregation ATPase